MCPAPTMRGWGKRRSRDGNDSGIAIRSSIWRANHGSIETPSLANVCVLAGVIFPGEKAAGELGIQ